MAFIFNKQVIPLGEEIKIIIFCESVIHFYPLGECGVDRRQD
jgi:hypothetical protein